jgi:prepilin-type N-terminal cleavage/methylation domain-containing protein
MSNPERSGFTLAEVLVAMTILSIGVLGVLEVFSLSWRYGQQSGDRRQAVQMAQAELELAVHSQEDVSAGRSATAGVYQWELKVADAAEGLKKATITVSWTRRGQTQSLKFSQIFRPRRP